MSIFSVKFSQKISLFLYARLDSRPLFKSVTICHRLTAINLTLNYKRTLLWIPAFYGMTFLDILQQSQDTRRLNPETGLFFP